MTRPMGTPEPGGGGATVVDPEALHRIGDGLTELSERLTSALHAVDAVPVDEVGRVVGPVGGDFVAALTAATDRHRTVLASLTDVVHAAGELVHDSGRLYSDTDAGTADEVRRTGA